MNEPHRSQKVTKNEEKLKIVVRSYEIVILAYCFRLFYYKVLLGENVNHSY